MRGGFIYHFLIFSFSCTQVSQFVFSMYKRHPSDNTRDRANKAAVECDKSHRTSAAREDGSSSWVTRLQPYGALNPCLLTCGSLEHAGGVRDRKQGKPSVPLTLHWGRKEEVQATTYIPYILFAYKNHATQLVDHRFTNTYASLSARSLSKCSSHSSYLVGNDLDLAQQALA